MKILKFNNILELVLFIIMLGLFVIPLEINPNMSFVFENVIGKVLIAIVILSFFTFNPLLGLVSILLVFKLFNLYNKNNNGMMRDYIPSTKKKNKILNKYNNFPSTLEESVVKNIKEFKYNNNLNRENIIYKPTLCKTYNAQKFSK